MCPATVSVVSAGQYWEQGQAAMHQGHVEDAIHCYEQSLAADPQLVRCHLSLAAAYLEKGDLGEMISLCQGVGCFHLEFVLVDADALEIGVQLRHCA